MKNIINILIIFIVSQFTVKAQSLTYSFGNGMSTNANNFNLSYSIGETFVKTHNNKSFKITEGFEQPLPVKSNENNNEKKYTNTNTFCINIYPNPATDYINIRSVEKLNKITKLEIINTTGELIISDYCYSYDIHLNISELIQGVYFIRIYSDKKIITSKFIKQ